MIRSAMQTELLFLGPPAARQNGHPITLVRAKGLALLLYLAATRIAQPRERLLDLLWPESVPQAARKNMRNTLWNIRETFGADVVESEGPNLRLAADVAVDLHALQDAVLLLEGGTVDALLAATSQYRGPLADGLVLHEAPDFELWLVTERERTAATYLQLLDRAVVLAQRANDWPTVRDTALRALETDPLREAAHLAAIEAFVYLGQRAQAAQQYASLADVLRRELDVAPLPETTARYQSLMAGDLPPRPAPARLAPPPHVLRTPFVGRSVERTALDTALQQARSGTAYVVLLAGELGIGKSRLMHEWASELPPSITVLHTYAIEAAQSTPFGPLRTLFRQPGPAHDVIQPGSMLPTIWLAELMRLLPEVASTWPHLPPPLALSPAEERARLLQALTEALRQMAKQPLVLLVDDLHWADQSTLDWLVYMLNQLCHVPLLLVGTYRAQDATPPLMHLFATLQRQGTLRTLQIAPLNADEAQQLLGAAQPASNAAERTRWIQQSGGNPLFLIELGTAQNTEDDAPPANLAALVRARLASSVPQSAYQVVQAVAVLGDAAEWATVRATGGRSDDETVDALDALVSAAILTDQNGTYRFVHPLVAAVVANDLSPTRRAFLHRRAAHALERLYPHPPQSINSQLARHYEQAGDTVRAADYATIAADQAFAMRAFAEATAGYEQTLAWQETAERHYKLSNVLLITGDGAQTEAHANRALRLFEQEGNDAGKALVLENLVLLAVMRSQPAEAQHWVDQMPLTQVQTSDPQGGAALHLLAASIARLSRNYPSAAADLDAADALLVATPHNDHLWRAAFERGNLLADQGDPGAAIRFFEQALAIAQANGYLLWIAMSHNNLAYNHMRLRQFAQAEAAIAEAMALGEQYAIGSLWQYLHSTNGEIALAQGQLDAAEERFAAALEAAQAWDNRVQAANILAHQAEVALARGQPQQAREYLAAAAERFGSAAEPVVKARIEALTQRITQQLAYS